MNNDLISRKALKRKFRNVNEGMFQLSRVYELIDNAPTVEFPESITIKCDTEEDKQKLLSALRNARVTRFVEEERPKGEWIPVSEKLPEDMQRVLVWFEYYRYGDYNCMYQTYGFGYVCDDKWSPFINGETGWRDAKIIAWMPLPKPYKEADDE